MIKWWPFMGNLSAYRKEVVIKEVGFFKIRDCQKLVLFPGVIDM